MPDMREKLVEQKIKGGADSICPKCFHSKVCRARDNQPCVECNQFVDANGVTVQRWIPVTERLPEDVYGKGREQIVVLVCTKSGKVSQCARMADYECIADETLTKVEWIKNGKFYWSKNKDVTHWMPMPEGPKEQTDAETV